MGERFIAKACGYESFERPAVVYDKPRDWRQPEPESKIPNVLELIEVPPPRVARGVPPALTPIEDAIERSRFILDLKPNFDGEGSPAYSRLTWERAAAFLRRCALSVYERDGTAVDAPHIGAGPQGSIDLHWEAPSYELLINIPADSAAPAEFYGDDKSIVTCIKGTLDPQISNEGLLVWLTKRRG